MDANTIYDDRLHALTCVHCFDTTELRRQTWVNPEALMEVREEYALDHSDCHKYKDKRKADQARQFRTERQRRELLAKQKQQRVWYA